jgi:hypothetical protein
LRLLLKFSGWSSLRRTLRVARFPEVSVAKRVERCRKVVAVNPRIDVKAGFDQLLIDRELHAAPDVGDIERVEQRVGTLLERIAIVVDRERSARLPGPRPDIVKLVAVLLLGREVRRLNEILQDALRGVRIFLAKSSATTNEPKLLAESARPLVVNTTLP